MIFNNFICVVFCTFVSVLSMPLRGQSENEVCANQLQDVIDLKKALDKTVMIISYNATRSHKVIGTGIIINNLGDVVTNMHVVDEGVDIIVIDTKGGQYKSSVLNKVPALDLAVLTTDMKLSDFEGWNVPQKFDVHEFVYILGCPEGRKFTVSKGKLISKSDQLKSSVNALPIPVMKLNAQVYPGNSGGPIIDVHGHLLGICLAKSTDEYTEYGYALDGELVLMVADIIAKGELYIPRLDINVQENNSNNNLTIIQNIDKKNKSQSLLQTKDILLSVDTFTINNYVDMYKGLVKYRRTKSIQITIQRGDSMLKIPIDYHELNQISTGLQYVKALDQWGMKVKLSQRENLWKLWEVIECDQEGPAAKAGIKPGFFITQIEGISINNFTALEYVEVLTELNLFGFYDGIEGLFPYKLKR